MLILGRKCDESIIIDHPSFEYPIEVMLIAIEGAWRVKLGIDAPPY